MKIKEVEKFEEFLQESFEGGIVFRELRLSTEEISYLREEYPKFDLNEMTDTECSDGKVWMEVRLPNII